MEIALQLGFNLMIVVHSSANLDRSFWAFQHK